MLYGSNQKRLFFIQEIKNSEETIYDSWESIIMHLPYSFQGRRMLSEIYILDTKTRFYQKRNV